VWRRRLSIAAVATVAAVTLTACGSSSSPTESEVHYTYGPTPSVSAKLICSARAIADINYTLGVTPVRHPTATWHGHRYTCPYVYRDGVMTLSVQELPTLAGAIAYMGAMRRALGDTGTIPNEGHGGFTTTNGSAVTRKDNKVLLVEVGGLPANFGRPSTSRQDVAITVAEVILICWKGY
jgi:hypothetical protein